MPIAERLYKRQCVFERVLLLKIKIIAFDIDEAVLFKDFRCVMPFCAVVAVA